MWTHCGCHYWTAVMIQEPWSRTVTSYISSSKHWRVLSQLKDLLCIFIVHGSMLHKDTSYNYIMYIEHASLHIPSCLPLPINPLCPPSQCHLDFYVICGAGWKSGEITGRWGGKRAPSSFPFCLKLLSSWESRVPASLTTCTVKVTYMETVFLLCSGDSNKSV